MGNSNNFIDDGDKLPVNMPTPADAWLAMRARLDDEMPVGIIAPPGGIINVSNSLFRSVTLLFLLLLLSCPVLIFTGKNTGDSNPKTTVNTQGQNNTNAANIADNNKAQQQQLADVDTSYNNLIANNQKKSNSAKKTVGTGNRSHGKNSGKQTHSTPLQTAVVNSSIDDNTNNDNSIAATHNGNKPMPDTTIKPPANKQPLPPTKNARLIADEDTVKGLPAVIDSAKTQWLAGLWWKAQIPFSGAGQYFDGPNGKSQPYRLLIPGVWIAMKQGYDMLDAELNLFAATVYKPKLFYTINSNPTAQTSVDEAYKLTKTFGVSLALGYSRNFSGNWASGSNWWVGGNLQITRLTGATNTIDSAITYMSATRYNTVSAKVNNTLWGDFNKMQVRFGAQLFYKTSHWQAGIKTGMYFTSPISKYKATRYPLETELFLRWGLWRWKN